MEYLNNGFLGDIGERDDSYDASSGSIMTPGQEHTVNIFYFVGCSLSLAGIVIVLLSFIFFKPLRRHPISMIFWVQISEMIFSINFIVSTVLRTWLRNHRAGCALDASVGQFFLLASINWSFCISINFFLSIRNPLSNTAAYVKLYHIYSWGLALITTIIMLATDVYGVLSDGTCWIPMNYNAYRFLLFGPLIVYCVGNIAILVYCIRAFRKLPLQMSQRKWLLFRSVGFMVIFVISWIGPLGHRLGEAAYSDSGSGTFDDTFIGRIFLYADTLGLSFQSFFTSMLWLSFPDFVTGIKSMFNKIGHKLGKSDDNYDI